MIPCPQGCGMRVSAGDVEAHLRDGCHYRNVPFRQEDEVKCDRISMDYSENVHVETAAGDGGRMPTERPICENSVKKSKCKYEYLGCKYTGSGKAREKHENGVYQHFKLLADQVSLLCLHFDVLEQKTKGDVLLLQNENYALREGIKEALQQLEQLRDADDDLRRKMDNLQVDVQILRAKWGNKQGGGGEDGRPIYVDSGGGDAKEEEHVDRPIVNKDDASLTKLVQQLATRVNDQDEIIKALSAGSQNDEGMLFWKIDGYAQLKAESLSSRRMCITSRPFYTGRYGYRLCAKAFLGGDGTGRGSHLSLFVCITRGAWDDVLPWPFRRRITFRLLDRRDVEEAAKDDIKETVVPNPILTCFRKPTTDMNVGSGIARFASHKTVEHSGKYLFDDTIFVQVYVAASAEHDRRRRVH